MYQYPEQEFDKRDLLDEIAQLQQRIDLLVLEREELKRRLGE